MSVTPFSTGVPEIPAGHEQHRVHVSDGMTSHPTCCFSSSLDLDGAWSQCRAVCCAPNVIQVLDRLRLDTVEREIGVPSL